MYLYFIQAADGPVKIGLAADPEERRTELQIGNAVELVLLAAVPATAAAERELHARFSSGRVRGEWFSLDTPGLRAEITRALHVEAEVAYAERGLCRECGVRPIAPPRTRVCSPSCARARRVRTSATWRGEHAFVPPADLEEPHE